MRVLVACVVALAASSALAAPTLRLPTDARPKRYQVALRIDPRADTFSGVIDIDLDVRRSVDTLWLDATDIVVQRASVGVGAKQLVARVISGDRRVLGFAFSSALPLGAARLHIEYRAPLSAKEVTGVAKHHVGVDDYVTTQFAPIDARRAFPCFDEPELKVSWQLTLSVPASDKAFSNTNVVAERELGDGWKRVEFGETLPLPSYLIAFAVGPFEAVDAGRSAVSGTPLRIIVLKGASDRARWAAKISHEALERLETYFGTPYPFQKLDCLAVPHTYYGAMENPGLVMFDAPLLLPTVAEDSIGHRRAYAETATHEFSHQWFGNLVTMRWWDDVWLSEAFATFMKQRIVEDWQPSWGAAMTRVEERSDAMAADGLSAARPIHRSISSYDDIQTIYDAITYQKSVVVIAMFAGLVGQDVFRRRIQKYLADHARGSADAGEFLAAVSSAAGRDIAPAFRTFLDQVGTPVVAVALDCSGAMPVLRLEQRPYRRLGSSSTQAQSWQIPVCARWPDGHACMLPGSARAELPLTGAVRCPAWVEANDGGAGYYRVAPNADLLVRLERAALSSLTVPEKLSLVSDIAALADAGKLDFAAVLTLAEKLAGDPDRHVVAAVFDAVGWLAENGLVATQALASYRRYLQRLFGARAHALGFHHRETDDEETRLLREPLVASFAIVADDRRLIAEAKAIAARWLLDRRAVDSDLVAGALVVTARSSGRAQWEAWLTAARATRDRGDRERLLRALAQFREPALVKRSLEILEGETFDPREALVLFWGATESEETRPAAWAWLQVHFDTFAARLPRDVAHRCTAEPVRRGDDRAGACIFTERAKNSDGGTRILALALERMHLCAATKQAHAPSVARFFSGAK